MSILEKNLAEAIVKYEYDEYKGITTVEAERFATLLRRFYDSDVARENPALAQAIATAQASCLRHATVPIDTHLMVLRTWLYAEMDRRVKETRQHEVLEGADA